MTAATAVEEVFDNVQGGFSDNFNIDCSSDTSATDFCAPNAEILICLSSSSTMKQTQKNRFSNKLSLWEAAVSVCMKSRRMHHLKLHWDSGDDFEREGCAAFPWAHNGIQDKTYAPVNGDLFKLRQDFPDAIMKQNNPSERGCNDAGDGYPGDCPITQSKDSQSSKGGMIPESITVGVACERLIVVSCAKTNANCYILTCQILLLHCLPKSSI